jgi:predicted MFS family arabinose efflux permease
MADTQDIQKWFHQQAEEKVDQAVGGWARLKVLVLLACVLALDSADKTTVGAIAGQLKHALHIGNIEIGLLVTVSTGIGALATLPMGVLTDRVHRVKLLVASIILWSITMVVSGFANSYIWLLLSRLALGAVIATAAPVIASLTGDYFRPGARGRMWGYILSGELFGAGFGILISGEAAALLSWRFSFWVLAIISIVLAAAIWKWLPEPARGGQSYLRRGKEEMPTTEELQEDSESEEQKNGQSDEEDEVEKEIKKEDITPNKPLILEEDPKNMPFWSAVRYVLSIHTNVFLIVGSAFGYFFFTGIRTFAVVFVRGRFDLSAGVGKLLLVVIGLGAIVGVLITGRVADRLIEDGHINARITVSAVAFIVTAILFLAGFYMTSLYIAVPLFFLAAASLGGTNAPLDAARLDIMHSRLWGRAESVRTTLRYSFEAVAPIVFGWVSSIFGAQNGFLGGGSSSVGSGSALAQTFKLMLISVVIAGIVLYFARKTYPEDVATAIMSQKKTRDND